MYESLLIPWSTTAQASRAEQSYRSASLLRTKGTVFLLPPPPSELIRTYNAPPRPKTRMSSGAVALCKHFERGGASSEKGRAHPFWTLPVGSNDNKTLIASQILEKMLEETSWRNVMLLHAGVAVYEIRNARGFGMRWTLDLEVDGDGDKDGDRVDNMNENQVVDQPTADSTTDPNEVNWQIVRTTFRGFLEPIEGLDHELDNPS